MTSGRNFEHWQFTLVSTHAQEVWCHGAKRSMIMQFREKRKLSLFYPCRTMKTQLYKMHQPGRQPRLIKEK